MSKVYKEYCWHCLDEDKKPLEIEIKKSKELTKEMKKLIKESEEKYKDKYILKKLIFKGCPKCKRNIILHPTGYLEFYYPKKDDSLKTKIVEDIKEDTIKNMPEEAK